MNRTTLVDAYAPECPIRNILARFSDKWGMLVIHTLTLNERTRFSAIQSAIPDISKRMLSATLKVLVADGLVDRIVTNTVPRMVEYSLTPLGRSLIPHIIGIINWSLEHMPEIMSRRLQAQHND